MPYVVKKPGSAPAMKPAARIWRREVGIGRAARYTSGAKAMSEKRGVERGGRASVRRMPDKVPKSRYMPLAYTGFDNPKEKVWSGVQCAPSICGHKYFS
jgi:hypothetical protein